ncbi:helix-turn-helix domain-containing protein [Mucilaginibacter pedocola]|uniref:AraC family transcriptional regulator n=1 Tax=Mucilaginibacter pedocola TaxID=1792845 RepID=A0A1S9PBY6_9SPHI|nr:helix-turn-helix domain-containing protein [Mucilaginibacter pedocola]OOQ58431.1 AraC family transcriptional regulator [Mucilaginibacter pedocola]
MKNNIFANSLKTIGSVLIDSNNLDQINSDRYKPYIKVIYLPEGGHVQVDFAVHQAQGPALFFISPNQILTVSSVFKNPGYLIYYNRDFYCLQLRDEEVACDGLLFNNINSMPITHVPEQEVAFIDHLITEIENELDSEDTAQEEMLRAYLKQLMIKAARFWKQQHLGGVLADEMNGADDFRQFTRLVNTHYKQKHTVADYAGLMLIAPKTLTHKFKRMNLPAPNEVIKGRIMLEAKRLLVHTAMSAKEIAYELGYDDPAYFSRLFLIKTGESPSGFKTKFLARADTGKASILSVA